VNRIGVEPRPSGLVLLAKPRGLTSFRCLNSVKHKTGRSRVGHAGTLDRFASGLLVALVGSYARLNEFVQAGEKIYRGTISFGEETDTLDPEGEVVASAPPPDRAALEAALPFFVGPIKQRPPAYSALHIDGKRAYERALAGEAVEMAERPVTVYALELERFEGGAAVILVRCSAGTYIRSLGRDIALACGSRAHLSELERLAIGPFSSADAVDPELFEPERDIRPLAPEDARRLGLGLCRLGDPDVGRFLNGGALGGLSFQEWPGAESPQREGTRAVFDGAGRFLGLVEQKGEALRYRLVVGDIA